MPANKQVFMLDEPFSRAAGAALVRGNRVRLLKDATANYPAWIEAIESARKWIHFESYIIHDDKTGRQFADLLSKKARQGIRVRLIYDWFGSFGNSSQRFWRELSAAGVEVRCFNPPRMDTLFGWISRDHRKMIAVDGRIGYISGLCVGDRWLGSSSRKTEAWRDTGVEIEGPAIGDLERAFAETWTFAGGTLPSEELPSLRSIERAGDVALRIVSTVPSEGSIYRTDQLVAALARRSLWLSDAYFLGTSSYIQALTSAADSGVDVRLLIPGTTNYPIVRAVSRAGLRSLLQAGVRVFEWNGTMMHAKTAVADGRWARVGSTNLNLVSWVRNWELDVVVENKRFAEEMEQAYLEDLTHSTEIVLKGKLRSPVPATSNAKRKMKNIGRGSGGQTAAGIARLGHSVGAAITNHRELGAAERVILIWGSVLLAVLAGVSAYWPKGVAYPLSVICLWISLSLLLRAYRLGRAESHHKRRAKSHHKQNPIRRAS
jgi:cardiolipin synthase